MICIEDVSGAVGWGEVWCGMPASGALHRAALLREFVAPRLVGQRMTDIAECMAGLQQVLVPVERLAGEPGPVSQVLAGVDCALWDLASKRAGVPLFRFLGGTQSSLPCYASGLSPDVLAADLDAMRSHGFRAFKFKAGFEDARTLPLLLEQNKRLKTGEKMMIDANCGWDFEAAKYAADALSGASLEWIEEPLAPDRPPDEWRALAEVSKHSLAAGENLRRHEDFSNAFEWLGVVQPDAVKWGGVSGVLALGREIVSAGRRFCPHSFGTQVAAMTSAHILAAVGGDGYVELDVNPNPLRDDTETSAGMNGNGRVQLSEAPGIGQSVDLDRIAPYLKESFVFA